MAKVKRAVGRPRKIKNSGKGHRLSAETKKEILEAGGAGATLAALAAKFGVSVPTISRVIGPRRGLKRAGRPRLHDGASGKANGGSKVKSDDVWVEFSGDAITIKISRSKKKLVEALLADLL